MALHPDGMQLLLAFKEKLRAYHVGIGELLPWRGMATVPPSAVSAPPARLLQ